MDLNDQLRVLEAANSDPAKLALASVDLAYPSLSADESSLLKESLEAAAIPHWCDAQILAALMKTSSQESAARLAQLRRLSVVEPFPARGTDAVNVHEASRLALRKAISVLQTNRFRALSAKAVELFEKDRGPAGRIEWIYHLLCADPEKGATSLENDEHGVFQVARPEDRYALAVALAELNDSGLVHGRARVQVLFVVAWAEVSRGKTAQLRDLAELTVNLARSVGDRRAEGEAQALLGDVMLARGEPTESRAAYDEFLAISRRLSEEEPSNTALQRELGVAHIRVARELMKLPEKQADALSQFEQALAIARRLAEQDPSNAGWQSDLAVAYNSVGGALQAQQKFTEAEAAFERALEIRRRQAELDPTNADRQAALAIVHKRVGEVLQAQRKLNEAQAFFERALEISRSLAELYPSNPARQSGLAIAYNRVGSLLIALGKFEEAQVMFEKDLEISRKLAEQDPSNADWQLDLAKTLDGLGGVLDARGNLKKAQEARDEALKIRQAFG